MCFKNILWGRIQMVYELHPDRSPQPDKWSACVAAVCHARRPTQSIYAFTNWLNEPSSHSLPVCTQFVLFNSLQEENRAETELLCSFYLSVGAQTVVFWWRKKKVCQPLVTAMLRQTVPEIGKKRIRSSFCLTLLIKNVILSSTEGIRLIFCFKL